MIVKSEPPDSIRHPATGGPRPSPSPRASFLGRLRGQSISVLGAAGGSCGQLGEGSCEEKWGQSVVYSKPTLAAP